jgi:hypothetical protein
MVVVKLPPLTGAAFFLRGAPGHNPGLSQQPHFAPKY